MPPTLRSLLVVIASLWLHHSFGMHLHPDVFAVQSNATCLADYAWMNNAENDSPCMTVAYVIAACVGDTWFQPALPPNSHYDAPNGATATPCYCSWSCYNLMMGCTLCQNQSYTNDLLTWPVFSYYCPSSYTDIVFPQNFMIANNVSIPYWATVDPNTWSNALFDINQAQTLANQNHSDYYPSGSKSSSVSSSSSNHTDIGAIVGGAVGGTAALLIIAIGGYFFYRRRQYTRVPSLAPAQTLSATTNTHSRWLSDPSIIFSPSLTVTSSSPPMSYMATQPNGTRMTVPSAYSSFQAASPPLIDVPSIYTSSNAARHQRNPSIPII